MRVLPKRHWKALIRNKSIALPSRKYEYTTRTCEQRTYEHEYMYKLLST